MLSNLMTTQVRTLRWTYEESERVLTMKIGLFLRVSISDATKTDQSRRMIDDGHRWMKFIGNQSDGWVRSRVQHFALPYISEGCVKRLEREMRLASRAATSIFFLVVFFPTRFQVESTHHHRRSRLALITAQNQEFICSVPTNSMDCLSRLLICLVIEIDKYLKIQAESKILDFDSLCAARDWDSIRRGENSIACSAIHHEKIKSEFFSASFARRSTVNSVANSYFPRPSSMKGKFQLAKSRA